MKIILVSGHKKNWEAGASTVYLHLNQELQKLSYQSQLFNAEDYLSNNIPQYLKIFVHPFDVKNKILEQAKKNDVVEVAGNIGWRLFSALRSPRLKKRPLLVTRLHGLEFKDEQARITQTIARLMTVPVKYRLLSRHWLNWQEFRTIALADVVICHTTREADAIITARLKDERQVVVFPLGVDSSFILERAYNVEAKKVLWWGSWVERKGIYDLPRAFELITRDLPELQLTIGGVGESPQTILSNFSPHLRPLITVLPFVSRTEQKAVFAQHDLFLFPSLSEGFGLALLEAMATGMPCITTLTGMYDWLEHGQNCYIVPMNAPTAIARAIKRLSSDLELRRRIGHGARETAEKLPWQQFGLKTIEVYKDFASKLSASN
jgi:glycosyltransferase involved in cell wall biosynthesis